MTLETSKMLGGIGALLMFVGVLPYISYLFILEIIGVILVLISLNGLANFYKERGIFSNALYGVLAAIVGGIIAITVMFTTVFSSLMNFLEQIYPGWNGDWAALQGLTPNTNIDPSTVLPILTGMILFVVIVWIFSIIAAFFVRRSLKELSIRSGTGLFATSGLLLLIGAVLVIIGVGLLLVWIALLLLAIAFFTMKAPETVPPPPIDVTPPPTSV